MLNKKTVFVVGAGASAEIGLPVGSQLVDKIAKGADMRFEWGVKQLSGDTRVAAAISRYCQTLSDRKGQVAPYMQASRRLSQGLSMAPSSIDTYLDTHANDKDMVFVGKLTIANFIMAAEQTSSLRMRQGAGENQLVYSGIKETWYPKLQDILFAAVRPDELDEAFRNAAFVVFNYDRCVEHFLFNAVRGYFHVDDQRAAKALSSIKFIHPYGSIGPLRWQSQNDYLEYGADASPDGVLAAASRVRLFTEGMSDSNLVAEIHAAIDAAERIVFLGFAYHKQNVDLISVKTRGAFVRVYGTAFGMSEYDLEAVEGNLRGAFPNASGVGCLLKREWTCAELFTQLSQVLRQ